MTRVAGLDVGGTTARLRVVDDESGATLADAVHPNRQWAGLSDGARAQRLAGFAREHLVPLGVTVAVAGAHGADSEAQRAGLEEALRSVVPSAQVVNDAELVVPAAGLDSGTGVIAGTGSTVTSRTRDGRVVTVGGWGFMLGDEGGATGLVRDAGRAVLAAWDERRDDPLSGLLLSAVGVGHPHELGYVLATTPPDVWAQAARAVFEAADLGSVAAGLVVHSHVAALVAMLGTVRARGGDVTAVVAAGGVLTAQPRFFEAFAAAARSAYDETAQVTLLDEPPVSGAVRLALRAVRRPDR